MIGARACRRTTTRTVNVVPVAIGVGRRDGELVADLRRQSASTPSTLTALTSGREVEVERRQVLRRRRADDRGAGSSWFVRLGPTQPHAVVARRRSRRCPGAGTASRPSRASQATAVPACCATAARDAQRKDALSASSAVDVRADGWLPDARSRDCPPERVGPRRPSPRSPHRQRLTDEPSPSGAALAVK